MEKKIASSLVVPSDEWRIKIGTSDRKNHNTIYFEYTSFISPLREENPCSEDMNSLRCFIREETIKIIEKTGYFGNNFIVNFQIPDTRMGFGKKSYLSIQIFLKCLGEELLEISFNNIDQILGDVVSYLGRKLSDRLSEMQYSQHFGRDQN